MKKPLLYFGLLAMGLFITFEAHTFSSGAPTGRSGSPMSSGQTCSGAGCHAGPSATTQQIQISSDIPVAGFSENTNYTFQVTLDPGAAGLPRAGFMASVESTAGFEGTLATGGSNEVRLSGNYITHTGTGSNVSGNLKTYTFTWNSGTAPDQTTLYVAANFSNGNNATSGDIILSSTEVLTKNPGVGLEEATAIQIELYPNPASEVLHISGLQQAETFSIVDLSGKRLRRFAADDFRNGVEYSLPVADLKAGQYLLLIDGDRSRSLRFSVN